MTSAAPSIVTIPLRQWMRLDVTSTKVFQLASASTVRQNRIDGEEGICETMASSFKDGEELENSDGRKLYVENAIRAALLMTRTLDHFCRQCQHQHVSEEVWNHFIGAVGLGGFDIVMKRIYSSETTNENTPAAKPSAGSDKPMGMGFFSSFDGNESSYFDAFKQSSLNRNDHKDTNEEYSMGYVTRILDGSTEQQERHLAAPPTSDEGLSELFSTNDWAIYDAKLRPNNVPETRTHEKLSFLQIYDLILYSLFTRDYHSLNLLVQINEKAHAKSFAMLLNHTCLAISESYSFDDGASKVVRQVGPSLFEKLLEENVLPISLCRFIADIFNICGRQKLSTLDAISADLEQMVIHPMTCLYTTRKSVFGMTFFPVF